MSNVWKIAPGHKARNWQECLQEKCISIGWLSKVDLSKFKTKEALLKKLERAKEGSSLSASIIWSFVNEVKTGDIIVANKGLSEVVGIGRVVSDYLPPKHPKNPLKYWWQFDHARLVKWVVDQPVALKRPVFNQPTIQRLRLDQIDQVRHAYSNSYPELRPLLREIFPSASDLVDVPANTNEFVPNGIDHRELAVRQIRERRGQKKFRDQLLTNFKGKCAITSCKITELLEAAHISPYRGEKDNHITNGILLRTDIHTLFDLELLGINPKTFKVELSRKLQSSPDYRRIHGKKVQSGSISLSKKALKSHYDRFLESEKER